MHLVRCQLLRRFPAVLMTVAILLSCQSEAQYPKNKVKPKAEPVMVTPQPVVKPDLSKEFMVLGRRAFGAVDRLNEHLLDTKDVISRGLTMEMSDEKESWLLRATAAEKASDDLHAMAESTTEKLIAQMIANAVSDIQRNHGMVDIQTEVAVSAWNLHVLDLELVHQASPMYVGIDTGVSDASRMAMDRATSATEELLSRPCYLAAKEAVITGMFGTCDAPRKPADKGLEVSTDASPRSGLTGSASSLPGTSQPTPEESFARGVNDRLNGYGGFAVRAVGHTLVYAGEPADKSSAEEFAAHFQKSVVAATSRQNLRSFGFTQIRLETGGKTFEWPIN